MHMNIALKMTNSLHITYLPIQISTVSLMMSLLFTIAMIAKQLIFVHNAYLQLNMQITMFRPLKKQPFSFIKNFRKLSEKRKLCFKN